MHIPSPSFAVCPRLALPLLLGLLGPMAPAEIALNPSLRNVVSGNQCELKITQSQDEQDGAPTWAWQVVEASGGTISTTLDGTFFYHAPVVERPTTFHLRVADSLHPERKASATILVLPRIEGLPDLISETLMPQMLGDHWLVPVPCLTLFAGSVALPEPERTVFTGIHAMAFIEDEPALGTLNRTWLVADDQGLKVVNALGETSSLAVRVNPVGAMAVRPKGSLPANPLQVVYAQRTQELSLLGPGQSMLSVPGATVYALNPDHTSRILAGEALHYHFGRSFKDGPGPAAIFGRITGLAMAKDGTVFVADAGNRLLRRISPQGEVTTLAGEAPHPTTGVELLAALPVDGRGPKASFGHLRGLALDPATGLLYVADHHCIRRVTQEGDVTTILGRWGDPGFQTEAQGLIAPFGKPALNRPSGLQVCGEYLLIADGQNHAIRAFNLRTRELKTLVGSPDRGKTRLGPLGDGTAEEDPESRASLRYPEALALNPDGSLLVSQEHGLLVLEGLNAPWGSRAESGHSASSPGVKKASAN